MVYSSQHRTHFSFLNRRSVLKINPTCYLWSQSQFNKAGCVVNINKALYHMKCAELTALGISNQHFCKRNCMANMILFLSCLFFSILVKHQYSSGPDSMASKIQINKATRIGAVKPNTMQIGLKFHSITVYLHKNVWTKKKII